MRKGENIFLASNAAIKSVLSHTYSILVLTSAKSFSWQSFKAELVLREFASVRKTDS